jgi:bifunctional DNase/RNase
MQEDLIEVKIDKLVGVSTDGAAVFLRSPDKTFVIFIGSAEGNALARAIQGEESPRPMTHELLQSILLGFDITVKRMVISDIIEGAYCAILILTNNVSDPESMKHEVRIDSRPSDAFVLSAALGFPIYTTREVLDQVRDVTEMGISDLEFPEFPPLDDPEEGADS